MGVLRFLLVSIWEFGVDAVLTDLQRARTKYIMEVIESTRLLHGVCVTRHLRAMYGVAVKHCVETDVSDSRMLERRERHDST